MQFLKFECLHSAQVARVMSTCASLRIDAETLERMFQYPERFDARVEAWQRSLYENDLKLGYESRRAEVAGCAAEDNAKGFEARFISEGGVTFWVKPEQKVWSVFIEFGRDSISLASDIIAAAGDAHMLRQILSMRGTSALEQWWLHSWRADTPRHVCNCRHPQIEHSAWDSTSCMRCECSAFVCLSCETAT